MPWKESNAVSERLKFVARHLQGERVTDLCKEFGISRKTGHKIIKRFNDEGPNGLNDRRRVPQYSPNKTPKGVVDLIIRARKRFPTWGPKKLRAIIIDENPGIKVPVQSTIGLILKDNGLSKQRKRRRRASPTPTPFRNSKAANELWTIDFKVSVRSSTPSIVDFKLA